MNSIKLHSVVEFVRNGATIKQDKNSSLGIPITRIETISNSVFNYDRLGYANVQDDTYSNYYLYDKDVLLSHINSEKFLGRSVLYKLEPTIAPIIHGMNLLCIRFHKEVYNPAFFVWYSKSDIAKDYFKIHTKRAVNQASITSTAIKEMPIPDVNINEQNAIVSELDKIQAALDNKKEQLKKLDELIQSRFYEMFGDLKGEPIELNKVIDVVSGLVNPNVEPYCSQYHIGPGNIVSDTGEIIDCKFAKDEGLISNKYAFKKGMVLYSKIRPNLNKVAIPKFDGICSADMYPLILKESVVDAFIWKLLSSQDFLVYAIKHSGRARMPKLNRETLLAYKFILPPLPLQQAFAAYVEKVEQAKAIVNQEIAHLQELLDSRMDYYFRK